MTMKSWIITLVTITIFLQSCEEDNLAVPIQSELTGTFKVATDCLVPTSKTNTQRTPHVRLNHLTLVPKGGDKVWIEQLGVMAKIKDQQIDIPYQQNKVEQNTIVGYGNMENGILKINYSLTNDIWGVSYTCSIQGKRWEGF